ncbi:glycosyltransferase [bacterium]|nr:glycosyltransferase [bacterium]
MKVVWFSEIKWTYLTTRKQQIIRRFPGDWQILFVESYAIGKKNGFIPKRDGNVIYATVPFFKATPYAAFNRFQSFVIIRFLMTALAGLWVRLLCRFTGFYSENRVICTSNIYYADIIRRMKKRLMVYDCNDYPLGFSSTLTFAKTYFEKTIRQSDLTTTVSQKLLDDIRPFKSENIFVIGNGVDFELFDGAPVVGTPPEMKSISSPIIFFSGALSDWLDTELIQKIGENIPEAAVVLLGPVKSDETRTAIEQLTKSGNVFWIGEKKHAELPAYIRRAAVCMLPFKMNRRIIGANPNTLYEFLSCGKPVVTLNYSDEIQKLAPHVLVAQDADDFLKKIKIALNSTPDTNALKNIARENSWDLKAAAFAKLITDHLREKK